MEHDEEFNTPLGECGDCSTILYLERCHWSVGLSYNSMHCISYLVRTKELKVLRVNRFLFKCGYAVQIEMIYHETAFNYNTSIH